jgi:kumamolisin
MKQMIRSNFIDFAGIDRILALRSTLPDMSKTIFVIATTVAVSCAGSALAQISAMSLSNNAITPTSSIDNPANAGVQAHTNYSIFRKFSGAPEAVGPPFSGYFYETPASIGCIYLFQLQPQVSGCNPNLVTKNPSGGSHAVAIVDAFDDPNAFTDLQTFSRQFGVKAITAADFVVVYAPLGGATVGTCTGSATEPPVDPTGGWEVEESLDIEWAHAMAPGAKLFLVEAQSNSNADLFCAVSVANLIVSAEGGGEISMSWGQGEFPTEVFYDSIFTKPGVVYFASIGDSPGTGYPGVSPNVVSVGGTSISRNPVTGSYMQENNWQDAGGGPSIYEPRPPYQNGISNIVGNSRGTPDISSDANPYSGVWVLDNFMPPAGCTPNCWYVVGGTSVSSPTWAGFVNAAGSFAGSTSAELTKLYQDPQTGDFTDITVGSCGLYLGYLVVPGWDFCTGLGSPKFYTGK